MQYHLGFIGCGNMGGALVQAAAKKVDPKLIAVCDHNLEKVEKLQNTLGVVGVSAEEIAKAGSENLYVVTCFSDRDKLLALVQKEQ